MLLSGNRRSNSCKEKHDTNKLQITSSETMQSCEKVLEMTSTLDKNQKSGNKMPEEWTKEHDKWVTTDPSGTAGGTAADTTAMSTMTSAATMFVSPALDHPSALLFVEIVAIYVVVRRRGTALLGGRWRPGNTFVITVKLPGIMIGLLVVTAATVSSAFAVHTSASST